MSPAAMRRHRPDVFLCPKCGLRVDWPRTGIVVGNVPQHVVCPGTPMRRARRP